MDDPKAIAAYVKALDSELSRVGVELAIATACVVFGLLIEYWDDAKTAIVALRSCLVHRSLTDWNVLARHIKVAFIGGIFITCGVAAELWFEHRTNVLEGDLQTANGKLIAYLNDRSAANEQSAADANEKRLKLENRIADIFGARTLTPEQSTRISARLTGLRGTRIDVFVVDPGDAYTSSDDSISLGRDFTMALRNAKMNAEEWLMTSCASGVEAANVTVITLPDSKSHWIALRVRNAFAPEIAMASGVGSAIPYCTEISPLDTPSAHEHWAGANNTTIAIAIGRKIQPILTREMLKPPEQPKKP